MKFHILSIGCNEYSSKTLNNLSGAVNDATNIYNCLVSSEFAIYDKNVSKILKSPSILEVRTSLESILFDNEPPDVFTLFFAGHGGVSNGTYYLCLNDTRTDRMDFYALSLSEIFRIVSSSGIKHINLIIDACNTGGLVNDLITIIKPEVVGAKGSFGIAILAAAASDEYASEVEGQGVLTNSLLQYINGNSRLITSSEHLDLVTIGREISTKFINKKLSQTPSSWGINLYGPSIFCNNPFYNPDDAIGSYEFSYIPPTSKLGVSLQKSKKEFLNIIENSEATGTPKTLLSLLRSHIDAANDVNEILAIVMGVGYRILQHAEVDSDFVKLDIINVLLTALYPYFEDKNVEEQINNLIELFDVQGKKCLEGLYHEIEKNEFYLIQKEGSGFEILANYYYLSIRLTKIMGLMSQLLFINPIHLNKTLKILKKITTTYQAHFMCMSDTQAPFLYVFFNVLLNLKCQQDVTPILNSFIVDYLKLRGQVSKIDTKPEEAYKFIFQRYTVSKIETKLKATPNQIGPVLLTAASKYGIGEDIDKGLKLLDRCYLNLFIPYDKKEFSNQLIKKGQNLILRCGFDFWCVQEFIDLTNGRMEKYMTTNFTGINKAETVCCIASSFVQPNRLPIMMEI